MNLDRYSPDAGRYRAEDEGRSGARFGSVRRAFRILDLVSRPEGRTAKQIAREIGVSLSTCYALINVLLDEGYLERIPSRGGYRLGLAFAALRERRAEEDLVRTVAPVLDELAQRTERHVYLGTLSDGDVAVPRVAASPKGSPVGIVHGAHGASHALALGKVLLAGAGEVAREYTERFGLERFTPRTIVRPTLFDLHLERIRARGFATDVEEFAENLCCVAAPILGKGGNVEGAVGISTSARRFGDEARELVELILWAAGEASAELAKEG